MCQFHTQTWMYIEYLWLYLSYDCSKWVESRRYGCFVTWFCYQLIAKPGNKTAAPLWPDPNFVTTTKQNTTKPSTYFCELYIRCVISHYTLQIVLVCGDSDLYGVQYNLQMLTAAPIIRKHPIEYSHCFVVLCCIVVISSIHIVLNYIYHGLYSLRVHHLIGTGIHIINLRWSSDHLRFIMGILLPLKLCLFSE